MWFLTLGGFAMVAWAASRLYSVNREEHAWLLAPEALERARSALRAGDAKTGWVELRRALPAGVIRLERRSRCEHVAEVFEAAIGNADTLGLGEQRWWVLAAAATRLHQGPARETDRDMDEAERALVEQAVRMVRSRGRAAPRGEVRDAVREAQRAIAGDGRSSRPPRAPARP